MSISKNIEEKELGVVELEWIGNQLEIVSEMIDYYLNDKPNYLYDENCLDNLFEIELKELKKGNLDEQVIASAIGCALGQNLIDNLGFRWIQYTDEHGTDLAVKNDKTGWTAFPISSVYKRIESGEVGFVSSIVEMYRKDCSS